jgi:PAS domain S-box-containing protein
MKRAPSQAGPILQSLVVFLLLVVVFGFFVLAADVAGVGTKTVTCAALIVCAALISKSFFDRARSEQLQEHPHKETAKNFLFSTPELYTELYEKSPVPYLLISLEGEVVSANLAALRLFGLAKGKELHFNVFGQLQADEPQHLELIQQKFKNRIPVSDETVRVTSVKGTEGWALLSLFHFVSAKQHLGLLTLVDITKQKRIETAKSEFVSLASHQLRTPIAGIKWSAELLQIAAKDTLTEQQHKYIERLLLGTRRMAVLVDDFLRVSRFELGTFHPEYVAVEFKEVIEEILSEQAERILQKKLKIDTFYDTVTPTVTSDPNLLRMIATNLLSNAIKYTNEQGTIHVGYTVKDGNIVFSVADNGIGIPANDQEHIFGKLFRASNAVRNVPDGTGLGLYIVKEAVSVLHGKATFTSAEGNGTTFEVTIPLPQIPA